MKRKITGGLLFLAFLLCVPVSANAEEVLTYKGFDDAEADSYVTVETYVQDKFLYYADGTASLFAQSEDGAYFIYCARMDEETYEALTPGLKIRVSGYKSQWSGETEIVDGEIEIIDDGDTFIAEPKDVTNFLLLDDLIRYQNSYVVCKAMRIESSLDPDGNYVPFLYAWDGTGREGDDLYFRASETGVTYDFMVESDLCDADSETYRNVQSLKAGDIVTLEGYLYYYDGDPLMNVTKVTPSNDIKSAAAAAGKAIEDAANEIEEEAGASGSGSSSGSSKSSGSSSSGSSKSSGSNSSGSSRRSSSGSSSGSDPYNVEDYDDPELFYDDNYLDFDSFEDAELYWDDAQ